jgi:hypothetical protein
MNDFVLKFFFKKKELKRLNSNHIKISKKYKKLRRALHEMSIGQCPPQL